MIAWCKKNTLFVIFICTFSVLGFTNLSRLPIAWIDEVMILDCGNNFAKENKLFSRVLPNKGTEKINLCSPPAQIVFQGLHMKMFGVDIFYNRLPYFLLSIISILLLYLFCKQRNLSNLLSAIICILFFCDTIVFSSLRSMRVEVLELFLIICYATIYHNNFALIKGLIFAILLLSHLKTWPIVFVFFLFETIRNKKIYWKQVALILLPILALFFLYFNFIGFQFKELLFQMSTTTEKHQASGNFLSLLQSNFFGRFHPKYLEQIWMFIVPIGLFFLSIHICFFNQKKIWAATFLLTFVVWIFALAPHHRYWPVLFIIGVLMCMEFISEKKWNWNLLHKKWVYISIIFLFTMSFFTRHALAIIARQARDPKIALEFMKKNIPVSKDNLIIGESIAFYYAAKHKMDYCAPMYPQHYSFNYYKNIYYISTQKLHLASLNKLQFNIEYPINLLKSLDENYNQLSIYKIQNKAEWDSVFLMYMRDYKL